ncbi:hypothetical protein ACJIZ3_020101 [Penstemon smallii]|uniref:Uncharacterized protein n=1 Tax=Penstemon smallii TaxID=265156 RepID=A0ABD3SHN1_9LAMI
MDLLHINNNQLEIMHTRNIYSCDEFENEDDVYYSELKRQVLQLTEEDEENDECLYENKNPNMAVEARKRGPNKNPCSVRQPRFYYNWPGPGPKEDCAAPAWILNLWRTGNNGTGVFIPQLVQSRRKNKPRRKMNERGRIYKRVEKMN